MDREKWDKEKGKIVYPSDFLEHPYTTALGTIFFTDQAAADFDLTGFGTKYDKHLRLPRRNRHSKSHRLYFNSLLDITKFSGFQKARLTERVTFDRFTKTTTSCEKQVNNGHNEELRGDALKGRLTRSLSRLCCCVPGMPGG